MRRLPPLSAIRVFEAAARHEHFTTAANELGMTQAAVSYQIRSLEERVGIKLFERGKGRVRLTDAGRRLLVPLSEAFDRIDGAFAALRTDDESLLTISTTFTFANTWLAWRLGGFQIDHPGLAVRLSTSNQLTNLFGSEADVAIRAGAKPWDGLDCIELMTVDFTVMCTPSFLARTEAELGRALELADVAGLPLIGPQDDWWDHWFSAAGIDRPAAPPGAGLRLDSQADEGHAAMGGQGVALLTPAFWRNDIADGRLVAPVALTATAGYRYWLVTAPGRGNVPKIKRFREWLLAEVERSTHPLAPTDPSPQRQ